MAVTVLQAFPLVHRQGTLLLQNIKRAGAWNESVRAEESAAAREGRGARAEGLLFLHGLESNPGSSLQTEEEAGLP